MSVEESSPLTPDELADAETMAASDEAFMQFSPMRESLRVVALADPFRRGIVIGKHALELMVGGKGAHHPILVKQRQAEREAVGLDSYTL